MPPLQWTRHVGRQARRHHCCCCRSCQQQQAVGGCSLAMRVAAAGGRQHWQVRKERYAPMNASSKYRTRYKLHPMQARVLCSSACTEARRSCSTDSVRVALSFQFSRQDRPLSYCLAVFVMRDFLIQATAAPTRPCCALPPRSAAVNLQRVAERALLAHR